MTLSWPEHKNGQIPLDQMRDVGAGRYLQPDAAVSFLAMQAECQRVIGATFYFEGDISNPIREDAYRDLARQQYLVDHPEGGTAAPAGSSNHGLGLAADISFPTAAVRTWFRANCGRRDWTNAGDAFGEDWHKEYHGPITSLAGDGDATPRPADTTKEHDLMKPNQIAWVDSKGVTQRALFVPGTAYWLQWNESADAIASGLINQQDVPKGATTVTEAWATAAKAAAAALLPK